MSASPPSAVVIGASGGIGRALVAGLVGRGTYGSVFALSRSGTVEAGPVAVGPIDLTDEASVRIAAERVGRELEQLIAERGFDRLADVVGIAHERFTP